MPTRLTPTVALAAALILPAHAAKPFQGPDLSGVYDCTGQDAKEGPYTAVVTMALEKSQSVGAYGSYAFKMDVPDFGTYLGQAVATGSHIAITFALTDPSTKDYGTGLGTVSVRKGKASFQKFYYEAEFKGGNHGFERCVRR
jgi:hypothetical protein